MVQIINLAVLLAMTVVAQNTEHSQSSLERCAEEKKCHLNQLECVALCVGVPSPKASQVEDTHSCVTNCSKEDADQYKTCSQNCINKHFRKIEIPAMVNKTVAENKSENATVTPINASSASSAVYFMGPAILGFAAFISL